MNIPYPVDDVKVEDEEIIESKKAVARRLKREQQLQKALDKKLKKDDKVKKREEKARQIFIKAQNKLVVDVEEIKNEDPTEISIGKLMKRKMELNQKKRPIKKEVSNYVVGKYKNQKVKESKVYSKLPVYQNKIKVNDFNKAKVEYLKKKLHFAKDENSRKLYANALSKYDINE